MNKEAAKATQIPRRNSPSVVCHQQPVAFHEEPDFRTIALIKSIISILRQFSEIVGRERTCANEQRAHLKQGYACGVVELQQPIAVESIAELLRREPAERLLKCRWI